MKYTHVASMNGVNKKQENQRRHSEGERNRVTRLARSYKQYIVDINFYNRGFLPSRLPYSKKVFWVEVSQGKSLKLTTLPTESIEYLQKVVLLACLSCLTESVLNATSVALYGVNMTAGVV